MKRTQKSTMDEWSRRSSWIIKNDQECYIHNGILCGTKKEQNHEIYSHTDGTRDYHVE